MKRPVWALPETVVALHEQLLAACHAFGLVKNHPFVDGNKRSGFAVAILFPELNGCRETCCRGAVSCYAGYSADRQDEPTCTGNNILGYAVARSATTTCGSSR